jgi:hypothetical protein
LALEAFGFGTALCLKPLLARGKNIGKLCKKLLTRDLGGGYKGSFKSFFRGCKKEGLKGKIENVTDAPNTTLFSINFNLL